MYQMDIEHAKIFDRSLQMYSLILILAVGPTLTSMTHCVDKTFPCSAEQRVLCPPPALQ